MVRLEYTSLLLRSEEEYQFTGDLVAYSETDEDASTIIVASMVDFIAEAGLITDRTGMRV